MHQRSSILSLQIIQRKRRTTKESKSTSESGSQEVTSSPHIANKCLLHTNTSKFILYTYTNTFFNFAIFFPFFFILHYTLFCSIRSSMRRHDILVTQKMYKYLYTPLAFLPLTKRIKIQNLFPTMKQSLKWKITHVPAHFSPNSFLRKTGIHRKYFYAVFFFAWSVKVFSYVHTISSLNTPHCQLSQFRTGSGPLRHTQYGFIL